MSTNPWVWVAAFLTLAIYSFLYKDNPVYRFAEHIFMGVSVGYGLVLFWYNSVIPRLWEPLVKGTEPTRFFLLIPILIGALTFSLFVPRYSWLVKYTLAFVVGASAGLSIPLSFETNIFEQVRSTILTRQMLSGWGMVSNLIMFIGVIVTLAYFYFSMEHKGVIGKTARIGRIYIMIAFGASFGYTVMARVSLLIGRMQFLLHDWLGIIK